MSHRLTKYFEEEDKKLEEYKALVWEINVCDTDNAMLLSAIIDGKTVLFANEEDKFNALVVEWRRLRESGSSTDTMVNDAYGQIVSMGWAVVPLLLEEVEKKSGH